ncbi:hypothetical protein [Streptomyces cyaneus]|uniref:hypothetical protein n=1 Tax=Streptomyces cyaneus TaxID=1904 RepID=UPI0013E403DD|nr:hypothetical protein [Streptomyces cyaneus]
MAFFQAVETIDQAANILVMDLNQVPSQDAAVLARARELVERGVHELYASASRVDLAGPESVSLAARRVQSAVIGLRMLLDAVRLGVAPNYDAQCDEGLRRIEQAKDDFGAAARSVLEEPL